jgi:hypothetical protein
MGPFSAVLCVEADPILADLARARRPPELADDDRIVFVESSSPEEVVAAARRMGAFRSCSVVAPSGGVALDAELYKAMADALTADFEASWRNKAALMILGGRWARNIFDNLAALPAIAPKSLPRFPGAVLVCGAGPSLEDALPLMVRERGRLGVVACDTALGTLLAAGIEPDLVVCLEAQAHNLADFTCLGSRRTTLAADLSSHPSTFRAVRGPKCLTFVRITRSPFLSRVEAALREASFPFLPAPPLGSVGVHAVHVARILAQGPLFATGLDFCFEPGKTHARGCPSLFAEERKLNRLTRWPAQYAASFRERTFKLGGARSTGGSSALLSDPILLSYASLLADRTATNASGLYDLRGRGPSIGGRRIAFAQAESMLGKAEGKWGLDKNDRAGAPEDGFDEPRARSAVAVFLRGEGRRLSELRLSMRGKAPLARPEFRRLVLESDYLWWGFPDQDRAGDLPQDFLNRLVPQVEYWSDRIEALEASLG